ncbi:hypothetical protein AOLI_G00000200 [Acnodon oligacanthus]
MKMMDRHLGNLHHQLHLTLDHCHRLRRPDTEKSAGWRKTAGKHKKSHVHPTTHIPALRGVGKEQGCTDAHALA